MTPERNRGSPKLQFSKEELDNPELAKPIGKVKKAVEKYDKAQAKLPKKHRLKLTIDEVEREQTVPDHHSDPADAVNDSVERDVPVADESAPAVLNTRKKPVAAATKTERKHVPLENAGAKADAVIPDKEAAKKRTVRLKFEEAQKKPTGRITAPVRKSIRTAKDQFHRQAVKSNEDENVAVNAVLKADDASNTVLKAGDHAYHAVKLRPYRKADAAEKKLDKANIRYLEAKAKSENPQFSSNPVSRWQQKRSIKREYAAVKRNKSRVDTTAKVAEKTAEKAGNAAEKVGDFFAKHPKVLIIIALGAMLLIVMSSLQSCTPLAQSVLESIVIGTYPAEEADVRAAERAYAAKEKALKDEMDHYSRYHPEYDECHVDADEIWHDPYVLIAIISAYYDGQDWTIDTAMPVIEKYFALQYIVTETVTTETRYRTEYEWQYNPETGRNEQVPVQVPYSYTICNVTLENKNLSHLPVVSMSRHGLGMYALYMATHGNMEGIFTGGHASPLRDPQLYDIPQETLDADPTFAKLMEEAAKYIGYPYVWGGDSPETSFDCSGFVSYVFTNSGVYNTGRLGAKGLRSLCRNVSADNIKPGDVVFFAGTMGDGVEGVTHCGIYVGNGMMIHCGSPIGYANLNDPYWRQHLHSYGRMPGL